jgi:hypothetical protein
MKLQNDSFRAAECVDLRSCQVQVNRRVSDQQTELLDAY